jgi:hypothetical protein
MIIGIMVAPDDGGLDLLPDHYPPEFKIASLMVPDDLKNQDVYEIARKLAELLLERL